MASDTARARYWDDVYRQRGAADVSWFQAEPTPSLELLDAAAIGPEASVLDVGAGASRLVDALLTRGFTDLTALDVADEGLALARARLGAAADRVRWITSDLLTWEPGRTVDVWHDRAVFHFLTEPTARARYRDLLTAAVPAGGTVIVATFAEDGPAQCSGLDVCRYTSETLHAELGPSFDLVTSRRQEHVTPWGAVQPFTWIVLRAGT